MKPFNLTAAFGYAWCGVKACCDQMAFRLELLAVVILVPLAFWLESGAARGVLVGSVLLVPIVELLNTAIEAAIDRISPEIHPLSKRAKDAGGAAVLVSIVAAGLVWLAVLWN